MLLLCRFRFDNHSCVMEPFGARCIGANHLSFELVNKCMKVLLFITRMHPLLWLSQKSAWTWMGLVLANILLDHVSKKLNLWREHFNSYLFYSIVLYFIPIMWIVKRCAFYFFWYCCCQNDTKNCPKSQHKR